MHDAERRRKIGQNGDTEDKGDEYDRASPAGVDDVQEDTQY
jgi:hypothetical protein